MRASLKLAAAALLTLSLSPAQASAQATPCQAPDSDEAAALAADVAFFGEVLSFEEASEGVFEAKLEVKQAYKNSKVGQTVSVRTALPGQAGGVDLRVTGRYLVFAKGKGSLTTSACSGTRSLREPPVALGMDSLLPPALGQGSAGVRMARATHVFTAQVIERGQPFAGRWSNVPVKVKLLKTLKGDARGTITVNLIEQECNVGRKVLLTDADLSNTTSAPVEVGQRYLFFAQGDEPPSVPPCHDNITPLEEAHSALSELSALCGKKRCDALDPARAVADSARARLRREGLAQVKKLVTMCHKSQVTGEGMVHDIDLLIDAQPDGKAKVRNIDVRGNAQDAGVYDAVVLCILEAVPLTWQHSPFSGRPLRLNLPVRLDTKNPKKINFLSFPVGVEPAEG